MSGAGPKPPHVLLGLARLARFRADGLSQFGDTAQHFLNSLAPLVALPLVGSLLLAMRGDPRTSLSEFLMTLVALLAPPVVSQVLAAFWRKDEGWLRYAIAFNWCQWLVPVVLLFAMIVSQGFVAFGLSIDAAAKAALVGAMVYVLALQWFLARAGLGLGRGRATLLTVGTDLATAALVFIPLFADAALNGARDG